MNKRLVGFMRGSDRHRPAGPAIMTGDYDRDRGGVYSAAWLSRLRCVPAGFGISRNSAQTTAEIRHRNAGQAEAVGPQGDQPTARIGLQRTGSADGYARRLKRQLIRRAGNRDGTAHGKRYTIDQRETP